MFDLLNTFDHLSELGAGWAPAIPVDEAELQFIMGQELFSSDDRSYFIGELGYGESIPGNIVKYLQCKFCIFDNMIYIIWIILKISQMSICVFYTVHKCAKWKINHF